MQRQANLVHRRSGKLMAIALSVALVLTSCTGGSEPTEVGGERQVPEGANPSATSESATTPESEVPAAEDPDVSAPPAGATGELGKVVAEQAEGITCTPIEDGTDTVRIGPEWTTNMAYTVIVFEGSPVTERQFAVEVLDPGFSAATLRWEQERAVFDGIESNDDPLPVIEYYVSSEGQIDGLANSDEVREQALALNDDLAEELSEEQAEAGRAMIEAMSDEILVTLYATNELFFHQLDGTELRDGEPQVVSTVLPPAGNFPFEVPSIATTEITERANSAGCVVVTQRIVPDPEALAELVSDMSVEGENLDPDQVETISESTSAWVDATTGEVRRLNRSQARNVGGESIVFATTDLLVLDAG